MSIGNGVFIIPPAGFGRYFVTKWKRPGLTSGLVTVRVTVRVTVTVSVSMSSQLVTVWVRTRVDNNNHQQYYYQGRAPVTLTAEKHFP
eukprot:3209161-Rhodomonas_salina.2